MPDSKIVELGAKVAKNSSGYSLKDLVIGSEGTLAIITRATLKLVPLPKVLGEHGIGLRQEGLA